MSSKTLSEQIGGWCKHYNGLVGRGCKDEPERKCDAGVVYLTIKSTDEARKGFERYPCFREGEGVPCEKRHFPTPEEVAAEVAKHEAMWERLKLGIEAAHKDAQIQGFKRGRGGVGSVACPVCKSGTLHYSVASHNGHMHGTCTTGGCVSWMQ